MIQAFQKFSQSRVAKVFLAILALSFIAFFGGGNWFRPHDPNAIIAEVGNLSIGRYEFVEKVQQQAQRVMAQTGQSMTREEILNAGLPQMVLNQLMQEILFSLEAKHLGLTVSDQTVRNQIQSIKAFHNETGIFDKALFANIIRANGLSEDSFIDEIRQELIREQLMNAIMVGAFLPDGMVDRLFEAQYQFRQAAMLMVSPKEMTIPSAPSPDVLEAFYNSHQKEFETPELRTMTSLIVDPMVLSKEISVTEEEMKSTYDAKSEIFGGKPLDQVKPLVIAEVQKEKGLEKAFQLTQELDDKIAGGETLEELASATPGIELIKLENVDAKGLDRMEKPSPSLPKNQELAQDILKTAFSLEEATDSPFAQAKAGTYYMVRVDKVSPASFQPYAEIKDRVLKIWQENEQLKTAQMKAEAYVKSFNQGDRKVGLMTLLPNLSLAESSPAVSDDVKNLVFSLRPKQAGMIPVPEGFAVVVLNSIIPATAKVKEEKMASFKDKLLKQYQEDLVMAYLNALRIRYPVKVNRAAIKALFS